MTVQTMPPMPFFPSVTRTRRLVNLFTIPHTGTRWMMRLLGESYGMGVTNAHIGWSDAPRSRIRKGEDSVITLRDFVLSWITTQNRENERENERIILHDCDEMLRWVDTPHVHFARIDAPDRMAVIRGLNDFLGALPIRGVDWEPANATREDVTGKKTRYLAGDPDDETLTVMEHFAAKQDLVAFLRERGCSYPWMN